MVEASDYLGSDGISIRWGAVWSTILGASILAYFRGAVNAFLSLADIPIALLSFLANYYGQQVELVFGLLPTVVRTSFAGAIPFVSGAGLFGYVVAILIVLATTYSIAEVVSRVG